MSAPEKLFDDIKRVYNGPAEFSESIFNYLNRSARPEFQRVRELLEEWFTKYPDEEKENLRNRLRSDDWSFYSAFFELYLYNMLLNFDFNIEIHPKVERETRPDFKVFKQGNSLFLLEATTVMPIEEEKSAEVVEGHIYDVLNREIHSSDFFIGIEIAKRSPLSPSAKKMSKFISQELRRLNYNELIQKLNQNGIEGMPRWKWTGNGWEIIFFPIPKSPEMRGKSGVRPAGIFPPKVFYLRTDKKIRKNLKDKATRYGEIDLPYVIAINVLSDVACDREDIELALFGASPPWNIKTLNEVNGFWYSSQGLQNQRVSAVLISVNLTPWNIAQNTPILWHNPWAERPLNPTCWKLPQIIFDLKNSSKLKEIHGISAQELFKLDSTWPF